MRHDDVRLSVEYVVRSVGKSVVDVPDLDVVYAALLFRIKSIVECSPLGRGNGDVAGTPVANVGKPSTFESEHHFHHTRDNIADDGEDFHELTYANVILCPNCPR